MKQSLVDRIKNSRTWYLICNFFVVIFRHFLGTRTNDSDRLNWLLRQKKGEPIRGIFFDQKKKPEQVHWINYPPNVQWQVVKSYNEFRAALQWGQCELVSIGSEIEAGCHTGYRCLNLLLRMKAIGSQDPCAVYIHERDAHYRHVLRESWPLARIS